MKVELHLHTMRYSGCAVATPAELMAELIRLEYGAVFITEHDAVWDQWELDNLRRDFSGISIFPGMELSIETGEHLLVLGSNDRGYLQLRDGQKIIERARGEGHLTVLAHPYRWDKSAGLLQGSLLPDAMEFRTNNHDAVGGAKAQAAAERLGMPLVNAGDTHSLSMLNHHWIQTRQSVITGDDIRQIVLKGQYENCSG